MGSNTRLRTTGLIYVSASPGGWVDYHLLTDQTQPQLTPEGTSQAPIPVYGADGTTVIGEADVSQPYHR